MLFFDPLLIAMVTVALISGGIVKGVTGIGLPIVSIAILLNFLEPLQVLSIIIIPAMLTNLIQAIKAGNWVAPLKRFPLLIIMLVISLWFSARLVADIDQGLLFAMLGTVILLFVIASFIHPPTGISAKTEAWAGPLAGLLGGLIGGVSTIWGPPIMMLFIMLKLPKEEFVKTVGAIWFIASVPLIIAYISAGVVTFGTLPMSLYACIPGLIGQSIGSRIRATIDQNLFKKILLGVLFVIGLNLIRRALF